MNIVKNQILNEYIANLLKVNTFKDYYPNGLQIQGKQDIKRLVSGVTLNQELIDKSVSLKADAILVHHGIFWKGDDFCITDIKKKRIQSILLNDINIFAYHLPLDAHSEYGNNACLAKLFDLKINSYFGDQNLGCISIDNNISWQDLQQKISKVLSRNILVIGDTTKNYRVSNIAWCSGGAQSYFVDAIKAGCEVFISGEISEQYVHIAREYDVLYMVCVHHATERYGVQALGQHLAQKFSLRYTYVDVDSPI